jgi:hypothetical protein
MAIAKKGTIMDLGIPVGVFIEFRDKERYELMFANQPEEQKLAAMAHGYLQKLGDAYSSAKGDLDTAKGLFLPVWQEVDGGGWNRKGERGAAAMEILVEALLSLYPDKTEEAIKAGLAGMTKEEKKAVTDHPAVKKEVKRIEADRAEKAAKGKELPDLGGLFK